jgi:hypothetical protein
VPMPAGPVHIKAENFLYHLKNRGLKAHALADGHDGGTLA